MRYRVLFCMCFCSVVLLAQQPGQRFPNRPRLFPRLNRQDNSGQQQRPQQRMAPNFAAPSLDTDGDGVISEQEIYAAVQSHLNSERERNPEMFKKIMQRFDRDQDQQISMSEAMEIHKEIEKRGQQARQGREPGHGAEPGSGGLQANSSPEQRPLSDGGLLRGIKIEGLNLSSDLQAND